MMGVFGDVGIDALKMNKEREKKKSGQMKLLINNRLILLVYVLLQHVDYLKPYR